MQEKRVKRVQKSHFRGATMDEQKMSENQPATIDAALKIFLKETTKVLRGHAATLLQLTQAVERLQANQAVDHANIAQVTEQVNKHTETFLRLNEEMRQRLGVAAEGSEPGPVN
jgi:hypothetical protein